MAIDKPFFRIFRPFVDGEYTSAGCARYVSHPEYAESPRLYTKALSLIIQDLRELFEYIEPSMQNANCYSHRTAILLTRVCIEVEANFRAILEANGYGPKKNYNMRDDYFKVNSSHRLSSYQVKLPEWDGDNCIRRPFSCWSTGQYNQLSWYAAYNGSKHDRVNNFNKASLDNLIDAVCGLCVVLSAQFGSSDFGPGASYLILDTPDIFDTGLDGYFLIKYPDDWPVDERYDFDVDEILEDIHPFQQYAYP